MTCNQIHVPAYNNNNIAGWLDAGTVLFYKFLCCRTWLQQKRGDLEWIISRFIYIMSPLQARVAWTSKFGQLWCGGAYLQDVPKNLGSSNCGFYVPKILGGELFPVTIKAPKNNILKRFS